ncbi:hypothetical protein ABEB36_010800 [Hypothenemus hampei]|uniref:THAP-type domain-containing protein n=1 Tax=Hypothenemus hampei TaxID=57062 RepID=A0ABD1E2F5_HYPHA
MRCAVYGCDSDNQCKDFSKNIRFFTFPSNPKFASAWKTACCRKDKFNVKTSRVCDKHFKEIDFEKNLKHELLGYKPKNFRGLKPNAIPSQFLPSALSNPTNSTSVSLRETRNEIRARSEFVNRILQENVESNKWSKLGDLCRFFQTCKFYFVLHIFISGKTLFTLTCKQVNDWFDCFNTKVPETDSRERMKAFGLSIDIQGEIIDKMTEVMKNMRAVGKSTLMPFQKGRFNELYSKSFKLTRF